MSQSASLVSPRATAAQLAGPSREQPPATKSRLVSLDAYRGFVMLLMASEGFGIARYVRNTHASGIWPFLVRQTDHVQWRGCTLWDLIQPSFTFIVGVSLPFSLAKRRSQGQSFGGLLFHAIVRSLILIFLGVFLRSTGHHQTNFTFEDTLSQIGLGYTFLFLIAWLRPRWQMAALACILSGYWLAFALYPLPTAAVDSGWHALHGLNGFAAHWDKNTNLAWRFDGWFMNLWPRAKPFVSNEGGYSTLSFVPTLATMILGLLAGNLMHSRKPADTKFLMLIVAGAVGLVLGTLLDISGICPSVKRIWTPSWVLFSGGWACLLLASFYLIIDVAGWRAWSMPLLVAGMNSIAMYCLAAEPFRGFVEENLHTHIGLLSPLVRLGHSAGLSEGFFAKAQSYTPIVEYTTVLLVLWLICFWMYRRKIFLRI